jgi:hypothetical protein
MFEDEKVLEWCIRNKISVTQYFFIYLLLKKDFQQPFIESLAKRYVDKMGPFNSDDVTDLVERGFVKNLNKGGKNLPEFYMVDDKIEDAILASEDVAEELWNAYPSTFELPGGIRFIARHAGVLGEKDNAKKVYLRKIKRSKKKHAFVMQMLERYLTMVADSKINSMKLGDWIANDMWKCMEDLEEEANDYGIEVKK